ncbi:hypothetical protein [Parasedimentitalea psychrophila]|uniref:Uncharacterized protein n=1 Tax=Parasedimentitalea psychrophila TaxID=2997337 RepID=A0A9Y2KZX4_9RHOB|nr:hypothetical protein [Parasedimentitalea psychrophila]WIY26195.1 hypothetical protein QPJ95_04530 [Parasedimentitalea psychrophila]
MGALSQLAELARQDNRAAQIFLARVAEETHLHAHVTGSLPRAERVALLRQPGGLSGKSWLKTAQVDVPLALALLQSKNIREREGPAIALLTFGEITLGLRTTNVLIQNGFADEASNALLSVEDLPKDAIVLADSLRRIPSGRTPNYAGVSILPGKYRSINASDIENGITAEDRLSWVQFFPRDLWEGGRGAEIAISHTINVPSLQPLAQFCRRNCSESADRCTALGASVLSTSYHPFSSPLENLLSNEDYWASPRIEADVARRLPDLTKYGPWLRGFDACFGDEMTGLQARVR